MDDLGRQVAPAIVGPMEREWRRHPRADHVRAVQPHLEVACPSIDNRERVLQARDQTVPKVDDGIELSRRASAKVELCEKCTVALPGDKGLYLTCIKDPDGNMVEFVGPKK